MNQSRTFAFGANEYRNCDCPAKTAGYGEQEIEQTMELVRAAKIFDDVIIEYQSPSRVVGLATEKLAKRSWMEAVDRLLARGEWEAAEYAIDVAYKLGWNDE
jgi:hypothetical protein